jgi:opacity protein-like surface antigen
MRSLIIFVLCTMFSASGQYKLRTTQPDYITEGTFSFGGNLSFSQQMFERSSSNRTVLVVSPSFSYFILKKLAVGVSANFSRISLGSSNLTEWGVGPAARYYFSVKKFAPFAGLGAAYGVNSSSETGDKFKTTRYTITAGTDYFVTKDIALELNINYMFITETYPERFKQYFPNLEFKSRQISLAAGVNVFI